MLSMSINLCSNRNASTDEYENTESSDIEMKSMNEDLGLYDERKIEFFKKFSDRSVNLLNRMIRDSMCRNMIKKSLESYCKYLSQRLIDLNFREDEVKREEDQCSDNEDQELTIGFKINHLLYTNVISIVRVLRQEFENVDNMVEIELVIYFYEIIEVKAL
jgi:hypothetical protein